MPLFMNVPQSKICRWSQQQSPPALSGFFTHDYSACNIIIIFSRNREEGIRCSMAHADRYITANLINEELKWAGENSCLILLRRPSRGAQLWLERNGGSLEKTPTVHIIDDKFDAIALPFDKIINNPNAAHARDLCTFHLQNQIPPFQVLRHPNEKQLLVAQKINWITTLNAHSFDPTKSPILFNENRWIPLEKNEIEPSPKSKKMLAAFSGEKGFLEVSEMLTQYVIMSVSGFNDSDSQEVINLSQAATPYFLLFTHGFNNDQIFLKNVNELFHNTAPPVHQKEIAFKNAIMSTLKEPINTALPHIQDIMNHPNNNVNDYIKNTRHYLELYITHYRYAEYYTKNERYISTSLQIANGLFQQGNQAFSEKDYTHALYCFMTMHQMIQLVECFSPQRWGTAYYHIGATYHELCKCEPTHPLYVGKAYEFLRQSQSLSTQANVVELAVKSQKRLEEIQMVSKQNSAAMPPIAQATPT